MKKFLVLYMAPVASFDQLMKASPEEQKSGIAEWMKWAEKHKKSLAELGAPLGKATRVAKDGVSDVRNEVGGYSIIQANSRDEAAQVMQDNPHLQLPGGYVDVVDIVEMPGM